MSRIRRQAVVAVVAAALAMGTLAVSDAPVASASALGCRNGQEKVYSTRSRKSRLFIEACVRMVGSQVVPYVHVRKEQVWDWDGPVWRTWEPIAFKSLTVELALDGNGQRLAYQKWNGVDAFGKDHAWWRTWMDVWDIDRTMEMPSSQWVGIDFSKTYLTGARLSFDVADDGKGSFELLSLN